MSEPSIEALGDSALILRFGTRMDEAINAQVFSAMATFGDAALPGVRALVPTYASLTIHYDPGAYAKTHVLPFSAFSERVVAALRQTHTRSTTTPRIVEVPVCYGKDYGPDLEFLATAASITTDELIRRHTAPDYRVAMLGFAPGFPYLLGLDERLRMPRRATPRIRVPAGSVAIGGAQTGIYPSELPGGWHLIGRTPLRLFDAERSMPSLLAPGETLRFRAIDADEFLALAASTP